MNRLADLVTFYQLLDRLRDVLGGPYTLAEFSKWNTVPARGVYFFFEPGEVRSNSGTEPRVVRVGTHALAAGSKSTLDGRLKQHRGSQMGSGNHRGSIFRLLVGQALVRSRKAAECRSWGLKGDLGKAAIALSEGRHSLQALESPLEHLVTQYIGRMPFLWLDIDDEAGPESARGLVERNAIALLSNCARAEIHAPSLSWLGRHSGRKLVRCSGLWNQRHVEEHHAQSFLLSLRSTWQMTCSAVPTFNYRSTRSESGCAVVPSRYSLTG